MKLTLSWLKKHIPDFEISDKEQFKARVDTRLSEVESVEVKGEKLHLLVVAEIVNVTAHPNSDKLTICEVNVGQKNPLQIVCGAPNARAGIYTVACLPGGQVYPDLKITEREVMGVKSAGMLCALDELGLWPDHNKIIEIDNSLPAGTDVTPLFKDLVIEIENKALPHRPDVFSHRGIAREISAIYKTELLEKEYDKPTIGATDELAKNVKIEIKDQKHCLRYSGITLNNVKVGASPLWLQIYLAYSGIKPINNVVDITNFVMHDIGQPLHAFDLEKLVSREIVVRDALKGEKLTTIDHVERELQPGMLVISDKVKVIAVAGVMGGLETEISDQTNTIFLESANFEMYSIRRTSRRLGLRSEAVTRYEKGIDPNLTISGLSLACQMLKDICGAEIAGELSDVYPEPTSPKIIELDLLSIKRSLGVDIDKGKIVQTLENLEFKVVGLEKLPSGILSRQDVSTPVQIVVPSFRRDINAEYDIVEEVGRIFGYEHIPTTAPKRDINTPKLNKFSQVSKAAKLALSSGGLQEVVTYSMVGERVSAPFGINTTDLIAISQPISDELAFIRQSLLPSLLDKVKLNLNIEEEFGLFELSRVAENSGNLVKEIPPQPYKLAGMRVGKDALNTYLSLKYSIDLLSAASSNRIYVKPLPVSDQKKLPTYYHPKQSGGIYLDTELIGFIGNLHPITLKKADVQNQTVAAFELNFEPLVGLVDQKQEIIDISTFPMVSRDISFWQKEGTYFGAVVEKALSLNIAELKAIELKDRYHNKAENRVSLTITCKLQSNEKTLTQLEINAILDKIKDVITSLGHEIR